MHAQLQINSIRALMSLISVIITLLPWRVLAEPSLKGETEPTSQGAEIECGQDRRCRLDRLKRLNERKRRAESRSLDQRLLDQSAELDRDSDRRETIREMKPYSLGLTSLANPNLSSGGFEASWQWMRHMKVVGAYHTYSKINHFENPSFWSDKGQAFKFGLRYLKSVKNFSTYLELYALHLTVNGELSQWNNSLDSGGILDVFGGGFTGGNTAYSYGELEAHIIGLGGGVEWQFNLGLYLRLGLCTHYALYATHRDPESRMNLATRDAASDLISKVYSLVYDFSIGYSF